MPILCKVVKNQVSVKGAIILPGFEIPITCLLGPQGWSCWQSLRGGCSVALSKNKDHFKFSFRIICIPPRDTVPTMCQVPHQMSTHCLVSITSLKTPATYSAQGNSTGSCVVWEALGMLAQLIKQAGWLLWLSAAEPQKAIALVRSIFLSRHSMLAV